MNPATIFQEWFGVDRGAGRILAALYAGDGVIVPHAALISGLGITKFSLYSSMSDLRQAMERDAYMAHYGLGYRLTAIGLEECDDAIEDARRRGVAA